MDDFRKVVLEASKIIDPIAWNDNVLVLHRDKRQLEAEMKAQAVIKLAFDFAQA
jgi:hypothetical protein